MRNGTSGRAGWCGRLLLVAATLALVCGSASADVVRLRHLLTDEVGDFTALFSVLDGNRAPISSREELPTSGISMEAGADPANLSTMELEDISLEPLRDYGAPFRLFVLIPNTDQFNGFVNEDGSRPQDASGVRRAVRQALQTLPQRTDIKVTLGVYNTEVQWLPEFDTTRLSELSAELDRPTWVARPSTFGEDPFAAIENAVRTKLRREARQAGGQDFAYFFVIVTSAQTPIADPAEYGQRVDRLRGLLSGRDMSDVITLTVVYTPATNAQTLNDPSGEQVRFAQGVTPEDGTYRIVGDVEAIQAAMQQTVDEIGSSFVMRFNNKELETDKNLHFRLSVTPRGGAEIQSNLILAHVQAREFNLWKWIIIIGSILVGVVILLILIIWLIKRPKKEKEVAPEIVEAPVALCVQCGRQLRDDLKYCHHCAAEPNHGVLQVLEGPDSGWTYFLRDTQTVIGTAVGCSIRLNDASCSGNHFKISVQEGRRYLLEDLKSTNGTYIAGAKIDKQYLKNNEVIMPGPNTKIKFTIG